MLSDKDLNFNKITSLPSVDCADLEKWKLIAAFCLTKKDGWRKTLEKTFLLKIHIQMRHAQL
jgi:hypothetical protein